MQMKPAFKIHMIKVVTYDDYMGAPDGGRTFCGIDLETCSESLFENTDWAQFGEVEKTTCKRCLQSWHKYLKDEQERERQFMQEIHGEMKGL